MAGGPLSKLDPKLQQAFKNSFGSEVLKDSQGQAGPARPDPKPIFSLRGILGLGQAVELNRQSDHLQSQKDKVLFGISHLEKEQRYLSDHKQKELEKTIKSLQEEIQKLIKTTQDLDHNVEIAATQTVAEPSEYQITFFQRIQRFIANVRKNISEAGAWLESFGKKKKKRNYFWSTARDRKKGGEQYLFSNEHSAARSAT